MSVFLETGHLFLRNPHGGVEDVNAMKAAGFNAIFCNIKDYPPEEWSIVRENAAKASVVCGPWSRMCSGDGGAPYDRDFLDRLLLCAHDWGGTPYIVNGESEVNGHDEHVREIEEECRGDDWAFSTEPTPYANNNWTILADVPVLPQCFGPSYADGSAVRKNFQAYGVKCVVPTYGTYSGWQPSLYPRQTPYGLYTADDCGNNFQAWASLGYANPCSGTPEPPPTNGGGMEKIGSQHGITASVNRFREADPGGTLLRKEEGKWPPLSTLNGVPMSQWKAYDKLERTLLILAADHDG